MIRRLTVNYPLEEEDLISVALYKNNYDALLRPEISKVMTETKAPQYTVKAREKYQAPMCMQFMQLGYRTKIFGIREPWSAVVRLISGAFFGSLLAMIWF